MLGFCIFEQTKSIVQQLMDEIKKFCLPHKYVCLDVNLAMSLFSPVEVD